MDFLCIQFSYCDAATCFAALIVTYFVLTWKRDSKLAKVPPQPSGSWPFIGHLHLLGKLPHITLGKLADQYGPAFMINLGVHKALVVSSGEMAKECLGDGDKVFPSRPHTIFVERATYNGAIFGFSPYGQYWRNMRKIVTLELLSNSRVEKLKHVRIAEVREATKAIHDQANGKRNEAADQPGAELVNMKQWFADINMTTSIRLVVGKPLKEIYRGTEYETCQRALKEFFELGGAFVPADSIPLLRCFDIGGYEKTMKKIHREIDCFAQVWLDEHKRRRENGVVAEKEDLMDTMLNIFEKGQDEPSQFDADTTIKAVCLTVVLAATDTTTTTLIWALSLLLNNKNVLKKAQAELDKYVGRERQVEESDLKNLVYLQAILKETMRLYPAGPLSVPREAITDSTVNGYNIRAGTRLLVNLYKIHRDPKVWQDPLQFCPERFLTTHKDFDVRGQSFELMPFGNGRRICPGISFALQSMQFTLANLLHGFDISTQSDEAVDMTEAFGLTIVKASPLDVILTSRLSDSLY